MINFDDLSSYSDSELISMYKDLTEQYDILDAEQLSIKITLNSKYGAYGNEYYYFYTYAIARAITTQGRYLSITTADAIDKYFHEMWHNDTALHESMGIVVNRKVLGPVVVYGDTDSVYYNLDEVFDSCTGWKDSDDIEFGKTKFVLELYNKRLGKYLSKFFSNYSKKFKVEDIMNFELEKISRNGMFLTKKKYVLDISWTSGSNGGKYFKPGVKMVYVGGEIQMSSTPKYVKIKLKEYIDWMFHEDPANLTPISMISYVNKIRDEFYLQDTDVIAANVRITDYDKSVVNDRSELVFLKGAPFNVKFAGRYNFMLNNKHKKYKSKYPLIKSGDSIKYYLTLDDQDFNGFAYLPNYYPYEFAPKIDMKEHFNKVFLTPLNRYVESMGFQPIPSNLLISVALF